MVTSLKNDECKSFTLALQSSILNHLVGEIIFLESSRVMYCSVESLLNPLNETESDVLLILNWTDDWYSVFTGKMALKDDLIQLSGKFYSNYSNTVMDFSSSADRTPKTMLFDFEIDRNLLFPMDSTIKRE